MKFTKDGEKPVSVAGTTETSDIFHLPDITLNWTFASPVKLGLKLCLTKPNSFFTASPALTSNTPILLPYWDGSSMSFCAVSSKCKSSSCLTEEPEIYTISKALPSVPFSPMALNDKS